MRTLFLFALTVVISLLLVGVAAADIPRLVNFQGYLVDNQDTPLTGEYGVTFRIYDDSTGGKVLWSETDTIVVEKGLYSITLGQKNAIEIASEGDIWFALQITGQSEMKPRYRLASVLYSIMAANAKRLDGYEVSGTPEAGKLIPLGPDGKLPASVLPDHTAVSTDLTQRGRSSGSGTTKGFVTGELLDGTTTDDVVDDALEGEWTLVGDVLYTSGDWGIARGEAGNVLYGDSTHTMNNLGRVSRTGNQGHNNRYATVSGGLRNVAANNYSTVAGGARNNAKGVGATISGGGLNTASGYVPVVGGGRNNTVDGDYSAILGGKGNTITETADYSYLFGIGSDLTQDSTFMVDMPHIRFGDEVDGYEFPATDGADSQVMATDGNGQLSWVDVSGEPDDDWIISYPNMYSGVPGNVGVGTSSPADKLDVNGDIRVRGADIKDAGGTSRIALVDNGRLDLREDGGSTSLSIATNGNVGIGTTSPSALLDVQGGAQFGSSNVNLINSTGKIPALSSSYFSNLSGSAITNLNASNLSSGTVSSSRISGSYTGITQVGSLDWLHVAGLGEMERLTVREDYILADGGAYFFLKRDGIVLDKVTYSTQGAGWIGTFGTNTKYNVMLTHLVNYRNNGYVCVQDEDGREQAAMYVGSDGRGYVWADVKNFRVNNPNQAGTDIWYCCLEGPEAAAYVRGTGHLVNGNADIAFPEHFVAVASSQGITVQLTPLSAASTGLAVVEKSQEGFVARELQNGNGSYDFDYFVMAVRKGHEDYRVIRPSSEGRPAEAGTAVE